MGLIMQSSALIKAQHIIIYLKKNFIYSLEVQILLQQLVLCSN